MQLKYSNYVDFSHFHGKAVNNSGLGLPIYNRFDSIIKFNDLSGIAKEKIAEREIERLKEDYDIEDRELFDKIKKGAVTQSNAREIKHLIKDTLSLVALKKICGETEI